MCFDGTVDVCDAETGERLLPSAQLTGQPYSLGSLAIAGTRLLVPTEYQVEVLDLLSGEWLAPLRGFTSWAAVAALSNLVFTCGTGLSGAGVLCRWELDRRHVPAVGHLGQVNTVAFVGDYVVTGGQEGTVRRWAARDGAPAEPMAEHSGPVLAVTGVEVDGKPIAVAGGGDVNAGPDETLHRWDLEALTQWAPPIAAGHRGQTQVLAAQDRFVFSGGNGGRVSMWDVATGEHLAWQEGQYPAVGLVAGPDCVAISFRRIEPVRWRMLGHYHGMQADHSAYVPNALLGRLVGFRLYSVQFVMDYVQLRFDGPTHDMPVLNCDVLPVVETPACVRFRAGRLGRRVVRVHTGPCCRDGRGDRPWPSDRVRRRGDLRAS